MKPDPRALEAPCEDAQVGVTGHLLPRRPCGTCHTGSFLFLWPCLWVSPCHKVRQTSMKWSRPGDPLEHLRCLFRDTRTSVSPKSVLGWDVSGVFGLICRRQMSSLLRWCHLNFLNLYNRSLLTGGHHLIGGCIPPLVKKRLMWGSSVLQLKSFKTVSSHWKKQNETKTIWGTKTRVDLLNRELFKKKNKWWTISHYWLVTNSSSLV